jgi:hypothetical protein
MTYFPYYDPELADKITQDARLISKELYDHIATLLPYEQLDDLMAHQLLEVEYVPTIIFLDVDGVLNTSESLDGHRETYTDLDEMLLASFDERCVERLLQVLDQVPNAKIVISSSWRNSEDNVRVLEKRLGVYANRIIGSTVRFSHGFRGLEVEHYLLSHFRKKTIRYAILDDENDFFPHQYPFLVSCDMQYGLTNQKAYQLSYKLQNSERYIP